MIVRVMTSLRHICKERIITGIFVLLIEPATLSNNRVYFVEERNDSPDTLLRTNQLEH